MAAPSGTKWGSIVGGYGRIGLYVTVSSTSTSSTATIQVWFWSKYSVSDSSNTLYYSNASSATTSHGSVNIRTSVDSGSGWSTSNQVRLATWTSTISRGTSAQTRYASAKLTNVDRVGGTMSVSTSWTVPALNRYTVSYNANGGSGAPGSQTKYYGTTLKLSSTKPTRTGYTFEGWGTSANDTSVNYAPGANYTANASITLYAVWTRNTYEVTFNANGGTINGAESVAKSVAYNDSIGTLPTAIKQYATFVEWNTSAAGTGTKVTEGTKITKALTVYAIWKTGSVIYVKTSAGWKRGVIYVKKDGAWKRGSAYTKNNGTWKRGVN